MLPIFLYFRQLIKELNSFRSNLGELMSSVTSTTPSPSLTSTSCTSSFTLKDIETMCKDSSFDTSDLSDSILERFFPDQESERAPPTIPFCVRKRREIIGGRYLLQGRLPSSEGRTHRAMERQLKREIGNPKNYVILSQLIPHTASEWPDKDFWQAAQER